MNPLRFRRFDLLVSGACVALLASFAWYGLKGPRGYDYQTRLEAQLRELKVENVGLAAQKDALDQRVRLMRPESVDLDMLDELARTQLNMLHPNEVVVRLEN